MSMNCMLNGGMGLVCPCYLKKSLGVNRANVYLPWRRSFSKRKVKLATSSKRGMTTIAGSVGIDEVATDWLCEALRQADFLLHAVINNTFCAGSVFVCPYESIHCSDTQAHRTISAQKNATPGRVALIKVLCSRNFDPEVSSRLTCN
jgi:hypothetical protein